LLQDTFERILKYRSSYRNEQPFRAWAYTIARNALNDELKRSGRMPLKDGFDFGALPVESHSAKSSWEEREDQDRLQAALNGLSPNYHEVVDLAWKRELKYAEIARILNTSESNVKVRRHRACKQLQANYQKLPQ
jgi:RNA polymerase sigma-70 factor (ECF subfamily)